MDGTPRLSQAARCLLLFAAFCAALYALVHFWPFGRGDECPPGHMLWSCLSWDTFDRYEHQFREDVPIGTARPALIEYLTREQIAFRDSGWGPKGTAIFLRKDLSGSWKPQITVLIEIDANDRVSGIRFVRMLTGAP